MKQKIIFFIVFTFTTIHLHGVSNKNFLVDKIVAIVGEDSITLRELKKEMKYFKQFPFPEFIADFMYEREKLIRNKRVFLQYLVRKRILTYVIKKEGIKAPISKVEQYINSKIQGKVTKKQLVQLLREQNLNYNKYRKYIAQLIQHQSFLYRYVFNNNTVSNTEVIQYLNHKKANVPFTTIEYRVAHLKSKTRRGLNKKLGQKDLSKQSLLYRQDELSRKIKKQLLKNKKTTIYRDKDYYYALVVFEKKEVPNPKFEQKKNEALEKIQIRKNRESLETWFLNQKNKDYVRIYNF